jgi:hypothetical protein
VDSKTPAANAKPIAYFIVPHTAASPRPLRNAVFAGMVPRRAAWSQRSAAPDGSADLPSAWVVTAIPTATQHCALAQQWFDVLSPEQKKQFGEWMEAEEWLTCQALSAAACDWSSRSLTRWRSERWLLG